MLERQGPRLSSFVGGIFIFAGVLSSAYTIKQNLLAFLFTYAVIVGLGCAIVLPAPMQVVMTWFPDMPGLITGAVMCGSSLGPMLAAVLQTWLVNPENVPPTKLGPMGSEHAYFDKQSLLDRVPDSFLVMAFFLLGMALIGAALLVEPSAARTSEADGSNIAGTSERQPLLEECQLDSLSPSEVVVLPDFWLMWSCYFLNMISVNFVMNNVKVFGQSQGTSMTDHQLTFIVSAAALFNGIGRLSWGYIADQLSFRSAMIGISVIKALFTVVLCTSAQLGFVAYFFSVSVIFICVGGASSIWAGSVRVYFGGKHFGRNFGLVTSAGGFGWIIGAAAFELLSRIVSDQHISFCSAGCSFAAAVCGYLLRDCVKSHKLQR